jgi:hypothetical protein
MHMSTSKVCTFFFKFLGAMYDMRDDHIKLHTNVAELDSVTRYYKFVGLPGCVGLMDVLHIKWNNCPTGDHNRAKGKEAYPSLGFQCITNYNSCILGIFGPMFGAQNDKKLIKRFLEGDSAAFGCGIIWRADECMWRKVCTSFAIMGMYNGRRQSAHTQLESQVALLRFTSTFGI